jgi:hypothetical protein
MKERQTYARQAMCARCGHRAELHGIQSDEDASGKTEEKRYYCMHKDENGPCDCAGFLFGLWGFGIRS